MTTRGCVHLCLSVHLHQRTNMCVDPVRHMHTCTHECAFMCVTEHLACVSSKLGFDGTDMGRMKQTHTLLVWPV